VSKGEAVRARLTWRDPSLSGDFIDYFKSPDNNQKSFRCPFTGNYHKRNTMHIEKTFSLEELMGEQLFIM
jgi:hypothetical protein